MQLQVEVFVGYATGQDLQDICSKYKFTINKTNVHTIITIQRTKINTHILSYTPFAFWADKISASVNFLFVATASAGFAGP